MIVGVTVVWVVVAGILLVMGLGLRALATLLLLRLLWLLLLLSLSRRVGGAVAAVLGVASTSESRLVVERATLRVLAEVVSLGGAIATEGSLLRGGTVLLALSSLLSSKLVVIVIVLASILLSCGVV